jgi:N-acetylated-alpha-linked acidic dipeptidase
VVLPWKEAAKILSKLAGSPVPAGSGFQGALPFTYRLGPGPVTVRLDVQMEASRRPIRNVIATIPGRDPDRWVVLGTHHDAWSFGGMDPGTGLAPTFEVARGLAALARTGWRPERSIKFAFWDAEEFGLVGSTEYAEAMQNELREKAIVYINTDLTMRGRFDGGGTPSLRDFLVQVTRDVPHFDGGGSVYDRWRADDWQRQPAERQRRGADGFEVELAALGSGADFVAFQDYLGLPSLSLEFGAFTNYGAYHSAWDTRHYMKTHGDPGWRYGVALAELLGRTVTRLASAEAVPVRPSREAAAILRWLDGLAVAEAHLEGLAPLRAALRAYGGEAARLERQIEEDLHAGGPRVESARTAGGRLLASLKAFVDEDDPQFYRHPVYGWDVHALYGGDTLPGLGRAAREGDGASVARERRRLEKAVERARRALAE